MSPAPEPRRLGGYNADIHVGCNKELFGEVAANQSPDCLTLRQVNDDGSEDLIHICDWPTAKAVIDMFQAERGGRI